MPETDLKEKTESDTLIAMYVMSPLFLKNIGPQQNDNIIVLIGVRGFRYPKA